MLRRHATDSVGALAAHYRVLAPVSDDSTAVDDIIMLIRKTSPGPVIIAGGALARRVADRHPEVVSTLMPSDDRIATVAAANERRREPQ